MYHVNIIAEVGANHGKSLESALSMVDNAADAGADIVKFQMYTGYDLWYPSDSRLKETVDLALPEVWLDPLIKRCADKKVRFLCTPFSPATVDLLEFHLVEHYKVSSGDITYIPLLKRIAETKKPVYLSVGAATYQEIDTALEILGTDNVVILHCIPGYPTKPKDAYIRHILDLTERYTIKSDIPVGISSHLREWWVDVATIAYRAHTIEKHIDAEGHRGPERKHSLDPDEFAMFCAAVRDMEEAMSDYKGFSEPELYARENYRRSPKDWLRPYTRV